MSKFKVKYTTTRTVELESWNAFSAVEKIYKHGIDMIQTTTGLNELHGPNIDKLEIEEIKD